MAQSCLVCGSGDTGGMLDTYVCHMCGAVSDYRGNVISPATTDPGPVGPAAVTVSPADTSDPDNPTRVKTTKNLGDTFTSTETIKAGSANVEPQPIAGTPETDADSPERDASAGRTVNAADPDSPASKKAQADTAAANDRHKATLADKNAGAPSQHDAPPAGEKGKSK